MSRIKKIILLIFICFAFLNESYPQNNKLFGIMGSHPVENYGIIYSIDLDGSNFQICHSFSNVDGSVPIGRLVLANNQFLYGVTALGGLNDKGVLFSYDFVNNIYNKEIDFADSGTYQFFSGIRNCNDTCIIGISKTGGSLGYGAILSYNLSSHLIKIIYNFDSINGKIPQEIVVKNNKIYGTTTKGGAMNNGNIFCYDLNINSFNILHNFSNIIDEEVPLSLILSNNNLFGTMLDPAYGLIFQFSFLDSVFTNLFTFNNEYVGSYPIDLISSVDGNLYGITIDGGCFGTCGGPIGPGNQNSDCGTLFKYNLSLNQFEQLYCFEAVSGNMPYTLMEASNGFIYGATSGGGSGEKVIFSFNKTNNSYINIYNNLGNIDWDYNKLIEINYTSNSSIHGSLINISISPNPVTDILSIDAGAFNEQLQMKLLDLQGKTYTKTTFLSKTSIDVSHLPRGIYVLQIKGKEKNVSKKVVLL